MSSEGEGAGQTEEERLLTALLDALEVDARDRKNPDLRLRRHVFLEYIRLIPDWIAEWESAGEGGPSVEIGTRREGPITFDEAKTWAQGYWPANGSPQGRDWAEDEKRSLARAAALRRLHPDGGFGGFDADLETAAWFATDFARKLERPRADKGRRGPAPRGNLRQVANVHRALMVHFLVYAGLPATRNDESERRESACDAVAQQTRRKSQSFGSVKNEWNKYRRYFPHRGETPTLGKRYPLQQAIDRRGETVIKHWHINTDVDRRIVHHSWIQDYIARHWFVYDPVTGLPPPVV